MDKKQQTLIFGLFLLLGAVAIWARDRRWMEFMSDTLPLALGIPAAFFLGGPWRLGGQEFNTKRRVFGIVAAMLFLIGWFVSSITALSFGWAGLVCVWAGYFFDKSAGRGRLAWLLVLSFPWLFLEWEQIGWLFRISATVIAEQFFHFLAMPVEREGTSLNVLGVPVEVAAACAGWNLLQLTLLTGVALGAYEIRSSARFGWLLVMLPLVAWLANAVRILILTGIALSFGSDVATGALHGLTGLAVLAFVLMLTKGLCLFIDHPTRREIRVSHT